MEAAKQVLQRAIEFDHQRKYSESLVCYQEGLQLLMHSIPGLTDDDKAKVRQKVKDYMDRAEQIKAIVQSQKKVGKFHSKIDIKADQIGCSYSTLFSKYIDDKLTKVEISDPYVRTVHQLFNLLRFCELLIKKGKNLKNIALITGKDGSHDSRQTQQDKLKELKCSLNSCGVEFEWEFSDTLHDREIIFDNGWIIKIGRGLDYFKASTGKFCIGYCDFDLRKCHETTVDIYSTT